MPTLLPERDPILRLTTGEVLRLLALVAAMWVHGWWMRRLARRPRTVRNERALLRCARRWLACSARISGLFGVSEPAGAANLRAILAEEAGRPALQPPSECTPDPRPRQAGSTYRRLGSSSTADQRSR